MGFLLGLRLVRQWPPTGHNMSDQGRSTKMGLLLRLVERGAQFALIALVFVVVVYFLV